MNRETDLLAAFLSMVGIVILAAQYNLFWTIAGVFGLVLNLVNYFYLPRD